MTVNNADSRRGGRDARRAARAAPIPQSDRPVWPGMEAGRYKPLTDAEVLRIHQASLDILETIGMADAPPSGVELLTAVGGIQQPNGRITFPRALVEDMIAKAGRRFVVYGQRPEHDLQPWGKRVYFGTAGAAVHMVDAYTGAYRDSTVRDLYDIARVVDTLEHIHFFQRSVVCRDLTDNAEMDFNTCYAAVSGTSKHVGTSWGEPAHVTTSLEMLHMLAGGEDNWRARPFVSQSNCFVVPPLKFAQDACRCLEVAVRGGMPVLLVSAGQAGATSPAALAGALAVEMAECLAGLIYVNAVEPGAPAIFCPMCFISDLRTGAMSGGSPEQALLSAAAGQFTQLYDLTGATASGMTDSKVPDMQAGYERAYNHVLVANAGVNMIYESAGMMASLMGFSLDSLMIDNDIIGATQRTIRGIEVSEDALALDAIRDICINGPGHFLGSEQTLGRMQKDYLYPAMGDRTSPKEWAERGRSSLIDRAHGKLEGILASHHPRHVPRAVDAAIRARFAVRLPAGVMGG